MEDGAGECAGVNRKIPETGAVSSILDTATTFRNRSTHVYLSSIEQTISHYHCKDNR